MLPHWAVLLAADKSTSSLEFTKKSAKARSPYVPGDSQVGAHFASIHNDKTLDDENARDLAREWVTDNSPEFDDHHAVLPYVIVRAIHIPALPSYPGLDGSSAALLRAQ